MADATSQRDNLPALLLVDDKPDNLDILIRYLEDSGYALSVALNGEEALRIIEDIMPDLILLDVMMPGIDGFETCRRLKQNDKLADIPVIFMTALSDHANKLIGFEVGGVDYITKPIQQGEVQARIKTHITIQRQKKELLAKNAKLEEYNQEKNEFLGIAAHDLKNPLSLILDHARQLETRAKAEDQEPDSLYHLASSIHATADNMFQLIANLLDINRLDSGKTELQPQPMNLLQGIAYVHESHVEKARLKEQELRWTPPEEPHIAEVDEAAFIQVLTNLVSNAIKYSPPGRPIDLRILREEDRIQVVVEDQGQGLTAEDQQLLFGKFARLSAKPTGGENSTGLGLSIVKRMVEGMKGRVWAESEGRDQGSRFILEFTDVGGAQGPAMAEGDEGAIEYFPAEEYLATIRENAEIGDITGLQQAVREVEALGALYHPFAHRIQRFLSDFRFREIREFLDSRSA